MISSSEQDARMWREKVISLLFTTSKDLIISTVNLKEDKYLGLRWAFTRAEQFLSHHLI